MSKLKALFESTCVKAGIPGLACAITVKGNVHYYYAGQHSHLNGATKVSRETIFDLASLTKVLTTHQLCLRLISENRLGFDDRVGEYIPECSPWLSEVPIWRLANHTSGLPAHVKFYEETGPRVLKQGDFTQAYRWVVDTITQTPQDYVPGSNQIYSDLGYILLARICETVSAPLTTVFDTLFLHKRNDLSQIHWRPSLVTPSHTRAERYASTEQCPWRKRLLTGEVHDDNCWTMGGIAGHAGSFGTLAAVHELSNQWLRTLRGDENQLGIDPQIIAESRSPKYTYQNNTRTLGWDRTSPKASSSGQYFTPLSPGHLGFTGTSTWLDLDANVSVTLLTNRVCPTRETTEIKWVRPFIHDTLRQHHT
ncbi:MAG: serine hydrolase domain-containing protein [Bradymonadia bacterium]